MGFWVRNTLCAAVTCAGALVATTPASAAELNVSQPVDRDCTTATAGKAGVVTRSLTARGTSMISARLTDADGNWDLAIFDPATGALVAASTYEGGDEIAQGFAAADTLVVQACRIAGSDSSATLTTQLTALTDQAPRMQMVRVATPTEEAQDALVGSGLDLTEHGGDGYLDVVLHSPAEGALLADQGFTYDVLDADLAETEIARNRTEARTLRRGAANGLPSGRTGTYRRLFDYSNEMQAMAADNPKLVRYITLPFATYEGRPVEAIEVAPRVKRRDGRPTFVLMGAHHAREWPSAEHTIEFAYELINGWKAKNRGIRKLMRRARVVFVPIVNPDGFNTSREAGELLGAAAGRDAPGGVETASLVLPFEYQRKNCRFIPPLEDTGGSCTQLPNLGLIQFGVDPNRNYGGFWGGPGASAPDSLPFGPTAQDYRGPGPFSEPETQNIRKLISGRQVVTMITNHTFSNLVLHPPGLQSQGPPPDDTLLRRLADAMARENGYTSQAGFELYDTSGTTEDWSYNATGGLGYTFEIGPTAFHPAFASMIAEYRGTTAAAGDGGGNRAAYMTALRSTVKTKRHSVIRGKAPRGSFLTIRKKFKTPTSPVVNGSGVEGDVILLPEKLKSTLRVRGSGRFTWHVNPSTRPLVDPGKKKVKKRKGQPSDPITFTGDATGATPCADSETQDPSCYNDHPFTVPGGNGVDNGTATVRITWPSPASDWDMKIFRDSDRDGASAGETTVLGSSASGPSNVEEATIARPGLRRGKYVVRVANYAGIEPYDGRVAFGKTPKPAVPTGFERWKLTCRASRTGPILARRKVLVNRGERAQVNLARACL